MQFQLRHYATLESTSLTARELIMEGAGEGCLIIADEQTAGYGRRGNAWSSFRGNLMFTLVLHPNRSLAETTQLAFVMALAIGRAIEPLLMPDVKLAYKWPNDIMLDGEKVCGLLLETESIAGNIFPFVLLGVGLNLVKAPLLGKPATALVKKAKMLPESDEMLSSILHQIGCAYDAWMTDGFEWAKHSWLEKAFYHGETIDFMTPQGSITGKYVGIDYKGGLVLEVENNIEKTFYSGQIF